MSRVLPDILKKTVVLVGMMGAGKTAVGTALADLLKVPFLDSDREIEAASALTIAEIFERHGEAFFRDKESQVIARLLDGDPGILSVGGGAFLTQANREMIAERGVAVWLRADLDLLWNRVRHKDTRPLLRTTNPRQTLSDLLEARAPHYAEAGISVDAAAEYSIETMAAKVRRALLQRPDVLEGA